MLGTETVLVDTWSTEAAGEPTEPTRYRVVQFSDDRGSRAMYGGLASIRVELHTADGIEQGHMVLQTKGRRAEWEFIQGDLDYMKVPSRVWREVWSRVTTPPSDCPTCGDPVTVHCRNCDTPS